MIMKSKLLIGVVLMSLLGACVTPQLPEDRPRILNFRWDLQPESTEVQSAEVEQGEVFFTWTAIAGATHQIPSLGVQLAISTTRLGKLFCGNYQGKYVCYEDRDGNGAFDYVWQTNSRSKSPNVLLSASAPQLIETEVPFESISEGAQPVMTNTVGLVFNGPVRGMLNEDMQFTVAMGEFAMGWIDSKDAKRHPDGEGWSPLRTFPLLVIEDHAPKTILKPLEFTYTPISMTTSGKLIVEYSAVPVSEMNLFEKWDFEFEGGKQPEEWKEIGFRTKSAQVFDFPKTP